MKYKENVREMHIGAIKSFFKVDKCPNKELEIRDLSTAVACWYAYKWQTAEEKLSSIKEYSSKTKNAIVKNKRDTLFISRCTIDGKEYSFDDSRRATEAFGEYRMRKIIAEPWKYVSSISVYRDQIEPICIVDIGFPEDATDTSIEDTVRGVFEEAGYTVVGTQYDIYELEDIDGVFGISNRDRWFAEVGDNTVLNPDWEEVVNVDCRVYYATNTVIDDYWNFEHQHNMEYISDYLDPDEKCSVYERAGKDWYIAPTLISEEKNVDYIQENEGEINESEYSFDDLTEQSFLTIVYFKNNYREEQNKIAEFLNETVTDLNMKGIVDNFITDNEELFDYLEEEYGINRWDIASEIEPKDVLETAVLLAMDNYMTTAINIENDRLLKKMFRVVDRIGMVVQKDEFGYFVGWNNEKYHFSITEYLVDVVCGNVTNKEFIRKIIKSTLAKKAKKIEEKELCEKATKVFVGIDDSTSSGNCSFGTRQFAYRYGIDTTKIGGIRGDVVLDYEFTSYTKRAVQAAILRMENGNNNSIN